MPTKYLRPIQTILIVIGLAIGFQVLGGLLLVAMSGGSPRDADPIVILSSNGIAQLAVMFFGSILVARGLGQNPYSVFRLRGINQTPTSLYALSFPLIITAQFIGQGVSNLWVSFLKLFPSLYGPLEAYENEADELMSKLVTAGNGSELILIVLLVAAIPAISEETLFRGFAQTNLERSGSHRKPYFAMIVTAVVFGSIHLSLFKLPGLIILGAALGWMVYRSNNLLLGAFAHGLNNGIITILFFALPKEMLEDKSSALIGTGSQSIVESLGLIGLFLPFLVLFIYLFAKATSPKEDWIDREPIRIETTDPIELPTDDPTINE